MQRALKKNTFMVKKRSPSLGVLKMVEESIRSAPNYPTKSQLWRSLHESISQKEFQHALARLYQDNKIMYNKGAILWTHIDDEKREMLKGFSTL